MMSFEPLTGWRELVVTERRRKREFAHWMRRLVEEHYPQAEKIRVVLDNLSTHSGTAFYESFSAEVARKLARRIEFVYTPVHGSWLNMVEVEISVLVRQCLKRRLPDMETLGREAKAWCRERWSMRLLADRMVELGHVGTVSYETVRRTLKKTRSSHTSSASG